VGMVDSSVLDRKELQRLAALIAAAKTEGGPEMKSDSGLGKTPTQGGK
jgi:hypothetical protein